MYRIALITALIIAISIALLCIRLYFGKKFVHTHIDGNKALNKKGIFCVHEMDRRERRKNRNAVSEKSKQNNNTL